MYTKLSSFSFNTCISKNFLIYNKNKKICIHTSEEESESFDRTSL